MTSVNSFSAKQTLRVGREEFEIFAIDAVPGSEKLPFTHKILLENLLRTEDGTNVDADTIRALGAWDARVEPTEEIQFTPSRVVMQDFTGVPVVVDLATMREAVIALGGNPDKIEASRIRRIFNGLLGFFGDFFQIRHGDYILEAGTEPGNQALVSR